METQFYIVFTLKTHNGLESIAKFFLGNDRHDAYMLFNQLMGTYKVEENNLLFIDFMEIRTGLPVNLKMITCTLNELGENCKIITKALFKSKNLGNHQLR